MDLQPASIQCLLILHALPLIVQADEITDIRNRSLILSTAHEFLDEKGRPLSNIARRTGHADVADNPTFQAVEGVGMTASNMEPRMVAARKIYAGLRTARQMAVAIGSAHGG